MPEYTPDPHPIEDVSTSTAGMVGETERGPTIPRLVTSWQEYTRWYGDYLDRADPPSTPNIYLPYAVRGFFENGGRALYISRVVGEGSTTAEATFPGSDGGTVVAACGPGEWGNRIVVDVTRNAGDSQRFGLQVRYFRNGVTSGAQADVSEVFDKLTADRTQPNFAATVVNAASSLIRIISCPSLPDEALEIRLEGGTSAPAVSTDFNNGLDALFEIEGIALMAVPDDVVVKTAGSALIEKCESLRDRFAVLNELDDQHDLAQVRPPRDSSYGAFYYPKFRVAAPHTPDGQILVPPCGHIMGLIARVNVAKGPTNETVRGLVVEDPLQYLVSNNEQDSLNAHGVNVIRDFRSAGRGVRVWGARTMSSDPQWRYINIRRLCIFLESSIIRGTRWVVFEPNSEEIWAMVRSSISSFLGMIWRDGALLGRTEEQAFFVKCDRTTMTQDDVDNGRLVCLIGVAPVKPAEFVIIRIGQKTREPDA